ncbi:hypothetical protein [Burkholderia sp. Ac-20365]|jgi:hypothetical protein|uniref:hypothetical protein n=1 Tax=Burkholderia sp. Ac-20365 TaxID=2703897 RepID=UPI00197B5F4B|nr:hypothetical protein [Burkholderia sp. Ac-20365]MBN3759727.1 hypothetical protein [Burkholderia sp. Ac-20365]
MKTRIATDIAQSEDDHSIETKRRHAVQGTCFSGYIDMLDVHLPVVVSARNADKREPPAHSTFRALQSAPLARLAANGTEHAHVRAVAILGYN